MCGSFKSHISSKRYYNRIFKEQILIIDFKLNTMDIIGIHNNAHREVIK